MIVTKDKLKIIIREELEKELNEVGGFKKAMIGAGAAIASMMPSPASAKQVSSPPPYEQTIETGYRLDAMNFFNNIKDQKPEISKMSGLWEKIIQSRNTKAINDAIQDLNQFWHDNIGIETLKGRLSTIVTRLSVTK